jgi:hypothetical protein
VIGNEPDYSTAENYKRFAAREARGRSALYEQLAGGVADDPELLAFLAGLPQEKRQPNLLLAAVRYLAGVQPGYDVFRAVVLDRCDEVAATMVARRTQTNEPARCATLLPALASLRQPLALLEVGASAGLCLLPDRYSYDYGTCRIDGHPGAPVLTCRCTVPVPVPRRPVEVAWRVGIDINPLDVTNPDDVRWLACLYGPEKAIAPTSSPPLSTWSGGILHALSVVTLPSGSPRPQPVRRRRRRWLFFTPPS